MAHVGNLPIEILIVTTPDELRKLADKMEKAWDKPLKELWGKDCTVEKWFGENYTILFAFDQEKIPRKK